MRSRVSICRFSRAVWLVALMLCCWGLAQSPSSMPKVRISNFKVVEQDDNGQVKWRLMGDEAVAAGTVADITGVTAEIHEKERDYLLFTPACRLNRQTRMLRSNEQVQVRSDVVLMEGEGFDFDLEEKRLTIRRDVRIRIFGAGADLLGKAINEE